MTHSNVSFPAAVCERWTRERERKRQRARAQLPPADNLSESQLAEGVQREDRLIEELHIDVE